MFKRLLLVMFISAIAPSCCYPFSLLDYWTDKTKPIISSEFRTDVYHKGRVSISFHIIDDETSLSEVSVKLDDVDVTRDCRFSGGYSKNYYIFNSEELRDGPHTLTIIAQDSSKNKNKAIQEITFNIDNTPPLLKIASTKGIFAQGKTGILYLQTTEPAAEIDGVFQGKDFKAYPYGSRYRAVLGFSIDDPGNVNYPALIKVTDRAGNVSDYRFKLYVNKTKFNILSFVLKPKKVEMLMPDTIRADWKKIEDIVIGEDNNKLYRGGFIKPTNGRISMLFGTKEFVNGQESGKHRGLDFAAPKGTPVIASNSGIVELSERLPAHGNCVVIDHGQGIYTYYAHLSKLIVTVGTKVKKGQLIGLVGATGVATGPHLHFSMSLHNLRVDPLQWLQGVVTD